MAYVFNIQQLRGIVRSALLAALATLAGMFSIWLDLGRAESFWHLFVFTNFTSLMGWMSWLYVIYFLLLAAALLVPARADRAAAAPSERREHPGRPGLCRR